jgi:formimidoylglutamate deiminase
MERHYRLDWALLEGGWHRDVGVAVDGQGRIARIETELAQTARVPAASQAIADAPAPPDAERVAGFVVPGMPNAHSHAFQRGMAGNTEYRLSLRDSFWTWRQAMYALANRIDPAQLEVIATQLFVEMLKAGYTAVAEFHYIHRRADATPYLADNEIWDAVARAAATAGIGLTFLPTLYQASDFGGRPLRREQARFALETDVFLRAIAERIEQERRAGAVGLTRTGAAFHSLRAVGYETLCEAARQLRDIDASLPVHIHVAEQMREVLACTRESGRRPVELLLDSGLLTPHWCLVHATHATPEELRGIATQGATVCVSITTEANLGDGFFDAQRFLAADGRLCIGSDSQISVNPAEELRWLEYQQRLRRKRRGALATAEQPHVGTRLWRDAALHGAQALGQPLGVIAPGRRADWLVLDAAHPAMAAASPDAALDHLVFAGGGSGAIRDVLVGGRWVVRGGRHLGEEGLSQRFAAVMHELRA